MGITHVHKCDFQLPATSGHSRSKQHTFPLRDLYLIAQSYGWNFKPRSILTTYALDLAGHSIEGGSIIVCFERVSVTNR